ncbi:hypothetical protein SAMN05443639_10879 [Stigmatella erecta]|uniref:Uncharacterized protein n=1 Tax=Stigmatella erecta TaxID=83460 RepID=A0A1I0JTD0_9BACT|nr:hypothetical protein SAMN05443639_10879 [Stigmatella erecta]
MCPLLHGNLKTCVRSSLPSCLRPRPHASEKVETEAGFQAPDFSSLMNGSSSSRSAVTRIEACQRPFSPSV